MSITAESVLDRLDLDRLLNDSQFEWDLRQGVIFNPAKTRLCLFSADLLSGVYKALLDEAGEAWSLIFKHCGQIWGARLARRLDREFQALGQSTLGELPLSTFLSTVRGYFAGHGWGVLDIEVERAQETGIVEARFRESVFAEVIREPQDMVDPMMSGILASLLSHLANVPLDCVQTTCISRGAPASRFLISAASRLEEVPSRLRAGATHDELVGSL